MVFVGGGFVELVFDDYVEVGEGKVRDDFDEYLGDGIDNDWVDDCCG